MLNSIDVLARTVWGEAGNQPEVGKIAVACVVLNRARAGGWWGSTITDVCLHPWQFSCWNEGTMARVRLDALRGDEPGFAECLLVAWRAVRGLLPDNTNGADSYYADYAPEPYWARGLTPTAVVGPHRFYRTRRD